MFLSVFRPRLQAETCKIRSQNFGIYPGVGASGTHRNFENLGTAGDRKKLMGLD